MLLPTCSTLSGTAVLTTSMISEAQKFPPFPPKPLTSLVTSLPLLVFSHHPLKTVRRRPLWFSLASNSTPSPLLCPSHLNAFKSFFTVAFQPASALLVSSCPPFSTHSALKNAPAFVSSPPRTRQIFVGGAISSPFTMVFHSSKCPLGSTTPGTSQRTAAALALAAISMGTSSTHHSRIRFFSALGITSTSWNC